MAGPDDLDEVERVDLAGDPAETVHLAQTTHQLPISEDEITAVIAAQDNLAKASAAFDAAEEAGSADEVQAARTIRSEAWQNSQRMLGRYADRVPVDSPTSEWPPTTPTTRLDPARTPQ